MFRRDKTIKKLLILGYCIVTLFALGNTGPNRKDDAPHLNPLPMEERKNFELNRPMPRIFSPDEGGSVRFSFSKTYEEVTIRIFNIIGSEIRKNLIRISDSEMLWDGKDEHGNVVPAGIYIYQLEAEGKVINGTIIIVR